MFKCEICGCQNFTISDGFGFCNECGSQSQNVQSLEYEYISGFQDNSRHRVFKIKSEKKKKEAELTTWEEFNYILLGQVNELIVIGANHDFKLKTLQIWTEYLRRTEVAFFSKTNYALPKLGLTYKKQDARVLYNVKPLKKVKKQKPLTKRARQMRLKKSLLKAEYESNISEAISGMSGVSGMSDVKPEPVPIDLQFSRSARKVLKRIMPLKHLKKHERDKDLILKCHKRKFSDNHYGNVPEKLSRNTIIAIIYMALNLTKDKIQLSDLIRFLNEGHLSYYDVKHFFPENLSPKTILKINITYNKKILIPSVTDLRNLTAKLCKFLNVQLVEPNMIELCSNYLTELSLPKIMNDFIVKILEVCPSEIKHSPTTSLQSPNYEGRAVSFILYLLKLIFKLDGKVEDEISRTAENLNKNYGTNIFVWTEWAKYIETRKIILKQCHFPTSLLLEPDSENNSYLYLQYVNKMKSKMSQEILNTNEGVIYPKIKSMLIELDKFQKPTVKKSERNYLFDASLQPSKDYLDTLLEIHPEFIVIPAYMSVKHMERDLTCYIKPNSFRNMLLAKGIDLNINTITNEAIQIIDFFLNESKREKRNDLINPLFYKFKFEDKKSDGDSDEGICEPPNKKLYTKNVKLFTNETDECLKNQESKIFDDLSDDELPIKSTTNCLDKTQFNMTNFEYWTYMGNVKTLTMEQYSEIEKKFSLSFAWLLNECSRLLLMDKRDLYHELLVTENFFSYVIKPFEKDQKNLLFQFRTKEITFGNKSIKKLRNMW